MDEKRSLKPQTRVVEAGFSPGSAMNSVKPPIYMTSTFVFNTAEDGEEFFQAVKEGGARAAKAGMIYSRINNPNLEIFESRLAVFDKAEKAAAFASGMAAIATTIMAMSIPESYMIYAAPLYGGSEVLFESYFPKLGIRCLRIHTGDNVNRDIEEIVEHEGRNPFMLFIETPANPSIEMTDIKSITDLASKLGKKGERPLVAIDNTFLGPIFQQPIEQGVDLVIYSCTKFIGGHSDMVGGATLGKAEDIGRIKSFRSAFGTTMSPFSAWLGTRSLETLDVRMRACAESARKLAEFLADHPAVLKVYYPEHFPRKSHQWKIYQKQCSGPGSLISFDLASKQQCFRFLNNLKVFNLAVSLGSNESLAEHPAAMTHSGVPKEVREKIGVGEGMARLSVGLEHVDDLIEDVKQALEKSQG